MLGTTTDDRDQLDPAEALMREVGAQLRQVRLERREELDDVAQHLRIKATYLFGIEQGDLSMMPGRTYALGFLRSYADYLGFDGSDLINQIKSTVADLTDKTRLRIRTPLPESRLPKTPILVLSLAAIAGIYAGWSYLHHGGQMMIETVAEVPGSLRNFAFDAMRGDARATGDASVAEPAVRADRIEPVGSAERSPTASGDSKAGGGAASPAGVTPPEAGPPAAQTLARTAPPESPALAAQPSPPAAGLPGPTEPEQQIVASGGASPAAPPGASLSEARLPSAELPRADAPRTVAADVARRAAPPPADAVLPAIGPPLSDRSPGEASTRGDGASIAVDVPREVEPPAASTPKPPDANQILARLASPTVSGTAGTSQTFEAENTDARVILRARDSSWIRVSSTSGDYLRTYTMQPGDAFLVPNRADLQLWTGNAGGLEVIVDGTILPALGGDGSVLRDVPLDPDRLRARLSSEDPR
jgi:cytoskeleton protein RodZ